MVEISRKINPEEVKGMGVIDRTQIVGRAREWLGTPYHHQASKKGIGVDCIGLVRGIWREIYGTEPWGKLNYSSDWGDANGNEDLLAAGMTYLEQITLNEAGPGDVVAMRWKETMVAKHVLILTFDGKAIHAYNKAPVSEIHLSEWWTSKFVAAFRFPGVD